MHRVGLGLTFGAHDLGFGRTLQAGRFRLARGLNGQLLALTLGEHLHALPFGLGRLGHGGLQLEHAPLDLELLDSDQLLALHLIDAHQFGNDLLLRLVGRNLVRLFGQGPLLTDGRVVLGLLDLEVARGLGLARFRRGLGDNPFLVSRSLGDGGFAHGHGAADGRVALGLGRGDVGFALDPGDVRAAHVVDVVVLVDDLFDGERDDLEAHFAHVVRDAVAHAAGDDLGLFDDLFDLEQADDAAQVTFHDQPQQRLAFGGWFGQELLGRGANAHRVRFDLDLRNSLDRDGDALRGVELLLGSNVKGHQLQRQLLEALK